MFQCSLVAYGFWQCLNATHRALTLLKRQRVQKRNLPLDVIVQDWQYWGNNGWVFKFDETNYPNLTGFIKEIHDLNAHFNISIWSNPDKNSEIGKVMAKPLYTQY
jgi:alpha-D-xyloside xylohydrolase